jgi:hypothetical protein
MDILNVLAGRITLQPDQLQQTDLRNDKSFAAAGAFCPLPI